MRVAGRYGLAPALGECPGVGAAGLTLGGGLGWLSGLYGAACDNLLSAHAERNPFFYTLSRVIERYVDPPPSAPDAPDPFRFASPGKLRDVLAEASAMAPSERLLQFTVQAPISVEDFWMRCEMSE